MVQGCLLPFREGQGFDEIGMKNRSLQNQSYDDTVLMNEYDCLHVDANARDDGRSQSSVVDPGIRAMSHSLRLLLNKEPEYMRY